MSAPPLDSTSSVVRLRGGRSGPSCRTSLGQRGRAASRRTSSRAAGPGAGAGEASSPTATLGEMPPAEDGFDVDVVVDGNVQAADRDEGDGEVDADEHLRVLLEPGLSRPKNALAAMARWRFTIWGRRCDG